MDAWLTHEASVRYYLLLASFAVVAVAEALAPRSLPRPAVAGRWTVNLALTALLSVIVALVFPLLYVGVALVAAREHLGLLNMLAAPAWIEFGVALLLLDAGHYLLHRLLHRVPLLWRLHRVHHSDLEFDCTTALRFHPIEALVTVGAQLAFVAALGASPWAVFVYQVALGAVSLFSHGSFALPPRADRWLRALVVTPGMHRIHHSVSVKHHDTNFGSVLPWWDRWFGTYRDDAPGEIVTGLADVPDARARSLAWLLASPFLPRRAGKDLSCRAEN